MLLLAKLTGEGRWRFRDDIADSHEGHPTQRTCQQQCNAVRLRMVHASERRSQNRRTAISQAMTPSLGKRIARGEEGGRSAINHACREYRRPRRFYPATSAGFRLRSLYRPSIRDVRRFQRGPGHVCVNRSLQTLNWLHPEPDFQNFNTMPAEARPLLLFVKSRK